jgi:hypothetical protein
VFFADVNILFPPQIFICVLCWRQYFFPPQLFICVLCW